MPDVYVDTDNTAGGRDGSSGNPYNSWNEAWEAEDANIAPGETWNFFCRGTAADTANVVMDTWPQSGPGDVTINIRPWHTDFGAVSDADDGWYQGDDNWSSSHYRLEFSSNTANDIGIVIDGDDETSDVRRVSFRHIPIKMAGAGTAMRNVEIHDGASGTIEFFGCRLWMAQTNTFPRAIRSDSGLTSAVKLEIKNNLFIYGGAHKASAININDSDTDADIVSNTAVYSGTDGEDFFDDVSGCVINAFNNVCYAGATTRIEFDSAGTLTKDYNATVVSADRGTNGFDCAQADFTDYGTGETNELTPATSQTNDWGGGGVTNANQSLVPLVDIRGNARNTGAGQNTAIGCFAASGEGGGGGPTENIPAARYHYAMNIGTA